MKSNFGKNKKSADNSHDLFKGGFSKMVKEREKKLPILEDAINEVLEDYDGGTICIIRIREDENGDADGHQLFIGGVSKLETQMTLGIALSKTADDVRDKLIDTLKDDPSASGAVLKALLKGIGE